jgi:DNA polymerase III delta subunit
VREFIRSRLAANPVKFSEREIQQLIQESGGHPQQLMQQCYRLYRSYCS